MKTIQKKLSDGTIAEKGMIVVVLEGTPADGNNPNTITKILDENPSEEGNFKCFDTDDLGYLWPWFWENPNYLRKATPAERKLFLKGNKTN